MEALFFGWLIIALTTALTALVRVYSPVSTKLQKDYPNNIITSSLKNRFIAGSACFLFSFILFPIMLVVMMVEGHRQDFIDQLAETVSQE